MLKRSCLRWESRREKLVNQIVDLDPDVLSLAGDPRRGAKMVDQWPKSTENGKCDRFWVPNHWQTRFLTWLRNGSPRLLVI